MANEAALQDLQLAVDGVLEQVSTLVQNTAGKIDTINQNTLDTTTARDQVVPLAAQVNTQASAVATAYQAVMPAAQAIANASQTVLLAKQAGILADGTDETAKFLAALQNNTKLILERGKTYKIKSLRITNPQNICLDLNGALLVCDGVNSMMGFTADTWGVANSVHICNGSFQYINNPNVRTDNIFPLWFQRVNMVTVENVKILNSWSAGVIFSMCSGIRIVNNRVTNTLADGITCFGCGRDILYFGNTFANTGDDPMAVTWLSGNTAADVGETTIKTKNVTISNNRVLTTTVSARGVFIGGVLGFSITGNVFHDVAAFSVLIANDTTVSKYSENGIIANNVMVNSGQTASSLVGECGGLAVFSQNLNIKVSGNLIRNANNVGILIQGNAYVTDNVIKGVTNTPSTQNPTLAWGGTGIASADFSGSNTCYGTINRNRIELTTHRAIWIRAGYNAQFLEVIHNSIADCVDPVTVGTSALGVIYLDSDVRNQVIVKYPEISESRTAQVVQYGVYVAGGGLHDIDYIGLNLPSGGTYPSTPIGNASGGTAIKRFLQATWNPGSGSTIAQGTPVEQNFSVAECRLRDQVIVTPPYQIPLFTLTGFVQSSNVVRLQMACQSSTAQTPLGSNTYTIRVRRQ